MVKLNSLLSDRFRKSKKTNEKMEDLAERSNNGALTSFSGVFKVTDLSVQEKTEINSILTMYKEEDQEISSDLLSLISITQEVKAINNQAIILHGERIKKAQTILKNYKEGAFTAWLITTYGNRQTPYNFLQYYEFYKSLSPLLKEKLNEMPKQAIYTLASREGELEKKLALVESYQGESKKDVLEKIREVFPLAEKDKRQSKPAQNAIKTLEQLVLLFQSKDLKANQEEKLHIHNLIDKLSQLI